MGEEPNLLNLLIVVSMATIFAMALCVTIASIFGKSISRRVATWAVITMVLSMAVMTLETILKPVLANPKTPSWADVRGWRAAEQQVKKVKTRKEIREKNLPFLRERRAQMRARGESYALGGDGHPGPITCKERDCRKLAMFKTFPGFVTPRNTCRHPLPTEHVTVEYACEDHASRARNSTNTFSIGWFHRRTGRMVGCRWWMKLREPGMPMQ